MEVKLETVNSWKKKIDVSISEEEAQPVFEEAYLDFRKNAKIEGFRKGKIPLSLIKKRFGAAIRAEASEKLINTFYRKAIEAENLDVVAPGTIQDISNPEEFPFNFTAEVEVEPEITVKDYTGLKAKKEVVKVTDDDVMNVLESLQQQRVQFNEIDGPVASGHVVEGDVQALDDTGVPIIGEKWENRAFEVGQPPFGPDEEGQLIGAKKDADCKFTLTHKDPDNNEEHVQKFQITIKSIKEKVLPELNDEFAKEIGDFESYYALKERIQSNLEAEQDNIAERTLRQELSEEIVKKNEFELPPILVDAALDNLWAEQQKNPQNQMDEKSFKETGKPMTIWTLQWNRIWHKIAEVEALEVSESDIDDQVSKISESDEKNKKKIEAFYKQTQNRSRLQEDLLEEKVFDFIKTNSKIKTVQVKKKDEPSPVITE